MAPRNTRSQRASNGFSRSQPQPSQTQRNRTNQNRIESDEEEEEPSTQDNGIFDIDEGQSAGDEIKRKVNQLVRLALFTEHRKVPLRREEITKKVLGTNSRIFNRVFDNANAILQKTFGMELVELPSKASLDEEVSPSVEDEALEEAKKNAGRKKKAAVSGSKTYILRSTLHPGLIEYAALMHDKILEEEIADQPSDSDDDGHEIQSYGMIVSFTASDQPAFVGVLSVILSLILVSGRVISDGDLRKHLKRLHLNNNSEIKLTALSVQRKITLERLLDSLIKQGYIDQRVVGEGKKKGSGKRARATQGDDDSGIQYEWRWGPRAHSEVGEKAIAQFVAEFLVSEEHQEDEDAEEAQAGGSRRGAGRRQANAVMSNLEKMMQGIEKAVGGTLLDLK
ncbi:MAGE-domain-containing protein [Marasmius fiardii PR-910]|nr:MAGE-domain-containing protein [Marasmius fiardii PR-910]